MKIHIANIKVCNVSEQCKIKLQIESLNEHSDGFKKLYNQDKVLQHRQNVIKAEEMEAEELRKRQLEINEMQKKKAIEVERECETIESECNVLKKRNKAIMLQLRRKLLETDEIRRNLMKNKNMETS
ncbi:unnamed protein product, partial [Iphiclides podalirius]